jgi:hypothetical protein
MLEARCSQEHRPATSTRGAPNGRFMRAGADPTLKILNSGGTGLVTTARRCYCGVTRYPDGGGLTAAERARREQVRLAELTGLDRKERR